MNIMVVKDYRKTATWGQPRPPHTIPTDLHSLLPVPSSNTPWSPLKIHVSTLASFLCSHTQHGVDREALPAKAAAKQIRGQPNNPESKLGKNMLTHYIGWKLCGLSRDAATTQKNQT